MRNRAAATLVVLLACLPLAHGAPDAGDGGSPRAKATREGEEEPSVRPRDLWREPPPASHSEAPTAAEWKTAEPVAARRPMPNDCQASLLREWVRIRCAIVPQAGAVLLGPAEDVAFFLHAKVSDDDPFIHELGVGEVVFPIRRGERRLIQLTGLDQDEYDIPHSQHAAVLISQQWLAGEPGPTLTLTPNVFDRNELLGARLATPEAARARGIATHASASDHGWPVVVEVTPGSPAAEGGAQVGDHLVMSWFGKRGLDLLHELLAFDEGSRFATPLQRAGKAEQLQLRRRR